MNSVLYIKSAKGAKSRFMRSCYLPLKLLNDGLSVSWLEFMKRMWDKQPRLQYSRRMVHVNASVNRATFRRLIGLAKLFFLFEAINHTGYP
jgi:hypothetical protein